MGLFAGGGVWVRFAAVTAFYGAVATRTKSLSSPLALAVCAGSCYACAVHAVVTALCMTDTAPWVIGKHAATGQVPVWSWLVWGPFHLTNRFFVAVAKASHNQSHALEVATEVWPGWWLGGWYSYELGIRFAATVDLCCELPERAETEQYMCCANWDGMVHGEDIAKAAPFLAAAAKKGPVLVHCAHGVGRSTATILAALVEAGHFETTEAAFAHCKKLRPVVKQSPRLKAALTSWQAMR